MREKLAEFLAAGLGAVRQRGPAIAAGCKAGAGALEYARDLACDGAGGLRDAVTVLEAAGVMKKRTARATRRACASVEVAGQVAAVVAGGARGVAGVVERGPARAAKGERG